MPIVKGIKDWQLLLVVGVAALYFTGMLAPYGFPAPSLGSATGTGGATGTGNSAVSKPVLFTVYDKYGGGALASQTVSVYTPDGTLVDSLTTDSAGQKATSASYKSGDHLNVLVVGSTGERCWYAVTVPTMSASDAQALTQNPVTLNFYDYTAPTITVVHQGGTALADTNNYNKTVTGSTATFTVTWYQGTTGNGYMASYDPINNLQQNAVLVMKLSGTNYETISVTGMEGGIERASAIYYYKVIPAEELTKWQVGTDFRLPGTGSTTVSLGLSGYSGDQADCDFYIYYFADWSYWVSKGNFGPNSLSVISGAPHTINLID